MNGQKDDSPASWAVPFLMVTALGIVGVVILYYGFDDAWNAWASRDWPKARGTVVSYSVEQRKVTESDNRERTTYYPHIAYRYEVNEHTYTGNRISFGDAGGNAPPGRWYQAESQVTVYYSLDDPNRAVLQPGELATPIWVLGVGVCFAGVGIPLSLSILARSLQWMIRRLYRAEA
jgi:hypothetical protein